MSVCEHLRAGRYPLSIDCVFDDNLGFTDCLAHCRECQASYLLEMIDWRGNLRLFRLSRPDPGQSARLLRDLDRGSCDLERARAESDQFRLANAEVAALLLIDMSIPRIAALLPPEETMPRSCWRELPCDGSWLDRIRSQV
jgi:hypothetical protein